VNPSLIDRHFLEDVKGSALGKVRRVGKDRMLVANLMPTRHLQYCAAVTRKTKRLFSLLGPEDDELRWLDDRQIGVIYYARFD
jgi:hypothetical protein